MKHFDQGRETAGKISAQPHPTLCIQFLNRENNDKNNTFPLGKQICFTIVWGCAETLPNGRIGFLMADISGLLAFDGIIDSDKRLVLKEYKNSNKIQLLETLICNNKNV